MTSIVKNAAITISLFVSSTVAAGERLVDLCESRQWGRVSASQLNPKSVTATQPDGMTPLHWAVSHGHQPTIAALLTAGADANAATDYGITPLAIACERGNSQAASLLLEADAKADHTLAGVETMLMRAARTGDLAIVEALLEAGSESAGSKSEGVSDGVTVDAKESRGQTALMWAAAAGHSEVVDKLLSAGANANAKSKSGFTPLFFAARNGRLDSAVRLIEAGVDVNDTIRPASTSGRNPRNRMSALQFAVESGHFELALKLVELGADPNDQRSGFAPLHAMSWVRRARRGDGVDGDPEPQGRGDVTSLEFVRQLVKAGAGVNLQLERGRGSKAVLNPKGCTPLILASKTADLPYMQTLIELGADPTITNADGCTALLAASGIGVKSLVDEDPGTEAEVIAAISFLLSLGLDLNEVDNNGETVMHGAAYRNYPGEVQFLAEVGAVPSVWNTKNKHGWSPRDIASGKRPGAFKPSPATISAIDTVLDSAPQRP